jgi:hypothetical protein
MWRNTVAINSILKKKTTKLNSQSAQYEKNKIKKDNSKKNHKKGKKTMRGNTSNPQCFKEKKLQN